jgi:hypothetical protein
MKVWTCNDHETHWPVGGASVVVAETEDHARHLLTMALAADGLRNIQHFTLKELDLSKASAVILCNGEY